MDVVILNEMIVGTDDNSLITRWYFLFSFFLKYSIAAICGQITGAD